MVSTYGGSRIITAHIPLVILQQVFNLLIFLRRAKEHTHNNEN